MERHAHVPSRASERSVGAGGSAGPGGPRARRERSGANPPWWSAAKPPERSGATPPGRSSATPPRSRRALTRLLTALALAALAGLAAAQSGLPDADLVVLTPEVTLGEAASVEVHIPPGMDFDLTVEWGDGATDNVDRFGAAVQTFDHVYATTGAKTVRLTLFDFTVPETHEIDTDVIVVTPGATLDVSPTTVVVGETVAATVTSGPEGGRLD